MMKNSRDTVNIRVIKHKICKLIKVLVLIAIPSIIVISLTSCTRMHSSLISRDLSDNKSEIVVELPAGQKLISVSWESVFGDPWYLTRPMHEDEYPETYEFLQQKDYDFPHGKIVIKESVINKPEIKEGLIP